MSMIGFSEYLTEQKNTHMEHIEDNVLNAGVNGARDSINFLRALRDMLAGHAKTAVDVSVKWDGAPAVFAGIDPSDGKFFVAKKGIFNKNPKVYKTPEEVDEDTKGDLAEKLKIALRYLPELNIQGVIQGDLLFTQKDIETVTIDGQRYVTFHPNTIVYAVPADSPMGKRIKRAKLGVVWHTIYTGNEFESMRANFAQPIASYLKDSKNVFSTDAEYKDISGKATMTAAETAEVTAHLSAAGKVFNKIDKKTLDGISDNDELLIRVKVYYNSFVRSGKRVTNTKTFTSGLINYLNDYFAKEEDKRSSEKGKAAVRGRKASTFEYFDRADHQKIALIFDLINHIIEAKQLIIKKMDQAKQIDTLLRTNDGYQVTGQEGFVAVDKLKGNAVKLVDRLQFSRANFSNDVIKGWQR